MTERATDGKAPRISSLPDRLPAQRLGVAVVEALVNVIVSGEVAPGESLPPELPLSQQFGVSRTVLRESVKRLEEKGMVKVGQGRGTVVQPTRSWNMMDRMVLNALIAHDESLGVLDELSVVRAQLEAVMAGETAAVRTEEDLARLRQVVETMRGSLDDYSVFGAADVEFHETVMAISGNRLAESIARVLFERARESARYRGTTPHSFHEQTLREHEAVFATIEAGARDAAAEAMHSHIIEAWQRRRLPDHSGRRR
ncbi:FCD domain-containing protein [Cellulomonas sp. NTE-D12]|uniref:FadR/GntR family transcriptional regulator n=1 Tax=Cellulomonas sp. NTE-D12 TaxID=2962632 RepID=UPI0030816B53|nr:GntR family transcriptional regulator [Cellulomonas sp. NTE-D12]